MNLTDPDLILVKGKTENTASYFQVAKQSDAEFTLVDLIRGGRYIFNRIKLVELVEKGTLRVSAKSELTHVEKLHLIKEPEIKKRVKSDKKYKEDAVIKRKMAYVDHINKLEMKGLTEKRLNPEIKKIAKKINDNNPPAWRTVIRWIKAYVESGWDKSALYPHHLQGNRCPRIDPIAVSAINDVNKEWQEDPKMKLMDAYGQVVEKLHSVNSEREASGLPVINIPTYNTMRTRFKRDC